MARNNKNYLRRIIEVQNITLQHTAEGRPQSWVFNNIIHNRFYICERTYYRYLAINAKAELKKLETC